MLVYGKPGVMRHMQRFYDVDFGSYADLSFYTPVIQHDINIVDNVCGDRSVIRSAKASN